MANDTENGSFHADVFDDDEDDEYGSDVFSGSDNGNDENAYPVSSVAKGLGTIREESHLSAANLSLPSVRATKKPSSSSESYKSLTEPTEKTQVQSARSISFDDKDSSPFSPISDPEGELQTAAKLSQERNFLRPKFNVTHDSDKVRSWESSMASLNITRESQSQRPVAASKALQSSFNLSKTAASPLSRRKTPYETSTPISGRSPALLLPPCSEIIDQTANNLSRNDAQDDSISNTYIRNALKNVKPDDDSMEAVKKFMYKCVPKQTFALNSALERSRAKSDKKPSNSFVRTGVTSKPVARREQPKLATVYERPSEAYTDRISSETYEDIAIKPSPHSYWGFVAIGEEVRRTILICNLSRNALEIYPRIDVKEGAECPFRLETADPVQILANETHSFIVIFAPKYHARFHHRITFSIKSTGRIVGHRLLGFGGTANVGIVQKSTLKFCPRSNIYHYQPPDISQFSFEVENTGDRAGFVHLMAVDQNDIEIQNITITPQKFCVPSAAVDKNENRGAKPRRKITVSVPDNINERLSRASLASVTSAASFQKLWAIKIHTGDERLRQRAVAYSKEENQHEKFNGLFLTKNIYPFENDAIFQMEKLEYLSSQDVELLKTQTRVITLYVSDNRLSKGTSLISQSRPASSLSNHPLQEGFYIPSNETANVSTVSIANTERTVLRAPHRHGLSRIEESSKERFTSYMRKK